MSPSTASLVSIPPFPCSPSARIVKGFFFCCILCPRSARQQSSRFQRWDSSILPFVVGCNATLSGVFQAHASSRRTSSSLDALSRIPCSFTLGIPPSNRLTSSCFALFCCIASVVRDPLAAMAPFKPRSLPFYRTWSGFKGGYRPFRQRNERDRLDWALCIVALEAAQRQPKVVW